MRAATRWRRQVEARRAQTEQLRPGHRAATPDYWNTRGRARRDATVMGDGTEPHPLLPRLRKAAGRRGTMIDVGAGTGRVALAVAAWMEGVVEVDPSRAMLGVLRRTAGQRGHRQRPLRREPLGGRPNRRRRRPRAGRRRGLLPRRAPHRRRRALPGQARRRLPRPRPCRDERHERRRPGRPALAPLPRRPPPAGAHLPRGGRHRVRPRSHPRGRGGRGARPRPVPRPEGGRPLLSGHPGSRRHQGGAGRAAVAAGVLAGRGRQRRCARRSG